jgi:alcohol dehydrogenase class IV
MYCGPGAVAKVGEAAAELGIRQPLVITDRGVRSTPLFQRLLAGLGEMGPRADTFDGVSSNPREEDVLAAREVFRETHADGLVALGGGSPIDLAKALRLLASHEGSLTEYDIGKPGSRKITGPMPPCIAVPTTAGTGSEVSRGALIVTRRDDVVRKTIVAGPGLVPSFAVLDPELTLELPPALTAGSGMDALSHCVEEYLSPRRHAVVSALALGAVTKIAEALPAVIERPGDLDARGEMLEAAMMAGIGFEKGLGVAHSLSHAIGALHDLHHGVLNAVLLPAVLEFNCKYLREWAPRELAAAAGLEAESDGEAVERLAGWLRGLNDELGIPARLRDLEDLSADRDEIIERALDDHCHLTNPRPCGPREMHELWEKAW